MVTNNIRIGVYERDSIRSRFYNELLGLTCLVENFKTFSELTDEVGAPTSPRVQLLILSLSVGELGKLTKLREISSDSGSVFPPFIITTESHNHSLLRDYLRAGASELLITPFSREEALVRIETTLSHSMGQDIKILQNSFEGIEIKGLTYREHQILTALASSECGRISRAELCEAIWRKISVHHKTLDVHIFNLRRKLRSEGLDIIHQDKSFILSRL